MSSSVLLISSCQSTWIRLTKVNLWERGRTDEGWTEHSQKKGLALVKKMITWQVQCTESLLANLTFNSAGCRAATTPGCYRFLWIHRFAWNAPHCIHLSSMMPIPALQHVLYKCWFGYNLARCVSPERPGFRFPCQQGDRFFKFVQSWYTGKPEPCLDVKDKHCISYIFLHNKSHPSFWWF